MLVPVYGFLEGDTMGLLVLAHDDMSIAEVIAKLRAAARVRTAWSGDAQALFRGIALDPLATVAEAGLAALDRIDVRRAA
ncbi:MAG TPA: toluene-4-monooxygenase system B family protein [Burkholderiaceae bacterium]|nr:toluene-4-monooxygenase system B family protein [Burkholderiaceae bacterium]